MREELGLGVRGSGVASVPVSKPKILCMRCRAFCLGVSKGDETSPEAQILLTKVQQRILHSEPMKSSSIRVLVFLQGPKPRDSILKFPKYSHTLLQPKALFQVRPLYYRTFRIVKGKLQKKKP